MAERKSLEGLSLRNHEGTRILHLGEMEIWDGADLSLLRDGLNHVILKERQRSVAIDMTWVKYVPSGFFGMLFDWFDRGVTIRLLAPQPRVQNMLWFRQFFTVERDGWFLLTTGLGMVDPSRANWDEDEWDSASDETSRVTAGR